MKDLLLFRRMMTPLIVQILFWVLALMTVVSAVVSIVHKDFLIGLATLILGPLIIRIGCEVVIVLFRIHDSLADMRESKIAEATEEM